jgi:hypothetical protein
MEHETNSHTNMAWLISKRSESAEPQDNDVNTKQNNDTPQTLTHVTVTSDA